MEADREKEWQDQYSRVIWGIGVEPLKALQTSSILLVGLGAVGVEIGLGLWLFDLLPA
jgi:tRNA A37 threonylcarbamoyladenosine dehydratase